MRWAILTASLLQACTALSGVNRKACQYPTKKPLEGCPEDTLLVGPGQKFSTIQSAVLSLPNNTTPHTILILPGNYTEQVNITRPGPVYLYGQTKYPNDRTFNTVNIIWRNATGAGLSTLDNAYTSTLTVAPTFNSSKTGTGPTGDPVPADTPFGNTDFRAYNLNLINDYAPYSVGPALAISISYANSSFYHCGIYSYQDTVYIGKLGNAYFHENEIAGQTDFFYGFGTAWVQSSLVTLRNCGGGITAWKGTNTTFENKYGVYIHDSTVTKANSSLAITGKCALGRPWNALHRSIFANCFLDDSVRADGYIKWGTTDPRFGVNTTMAEYKNFGPGWNETARRDGNVTLVLSEDMYKGYDGVDKVFQYPFEGRFGNTAWIDGDL
ncbi:Pectinesterase [Pyrenophora teres f. maculata]|nr:Pectinesterase [Pyrenophora teres f. maculata]